MQSRYAPVRPARLPAPTPFFAPWRKGAHGLFSLILAASAVPLAAQPDGSINLTLSLCGDPALSAQVRIPLERTPASPPTAPGNPHEQMPACHALCCPRRSEGRAV